MMISHCTHSLKATCSYIILWEVDMYTWQFCQVVIVSSSVSVSCYCIAGFSSLVAPSPVHFSGYVSGTVWGLYLWVWLWVRLREWHFWSDRRRHFCTNKKKKIIVNSSFIHSLTHSFVRSFVYSSFLCPVWYNLHVHVIQRKNESVRTSVTMCLHVQLKNVVK